jgi:hypothetical protein
MLECEISGSHSGVAEDSNLRDVTLCRASSLLLLLLFFVLLHSPNDTASRPTGLQFSYRLDLGSYWNVNRINFYIKHGILDRVKGPNYSKCDILSSESFRIFVVS